MASELLQEFESDVVYSPFLKEDFDPQVHASHLVQGVVIAEHLNKLGIGVKKLEKEIENQVGDHYEDLLSQATGVETLEDTLNTMHGRIQTLQAGVERLRARIVEPYNQISQQTMILRHLQPACELLRRIIRCLSLSQRLQEQLANGPKDITKAATSLRELDDIGKTMDLSGIDILEKHHRFIRQARSDTEKQATIMMDKGMELQSQSQVGTALQVFHNLGILNSSVDKVLNNLVKNLRKRVATALDVNYLTQISQDNKSKGPGKAIMPTLGQSAQFRANLWTGLEKVMDDIYDICVKTSHLHKVLSKKKDMTTHICFLEEVDKQSKDDLFTRMWKNVTQILSEEFSKTSKGSNLIRQALEVDYPKLLRLYGDLWKKVDSVSVDMRAAQSGSAEFSSCNYIDGDSSLQGEREIPETFEPEVALRRSLLPLEKAYISRSLSRLFDSVNLMFSTPGTAPSKDEIANLLKTTTSELNVSAIDKTLSEIIAKNVAKTLQLFCQKCEHLLATDGEASQVIGPPTSAQKLNVDVVNQLVYVHSQVERMTNATLAHLPQVVLQTLLQTLPVINALISSAVEPLFSSLKASSEAIILTMHKENFSSNDEVEGSEVQCSLYMKELQNFLSRAASDYVEPFHPAPVFKEKVRVLCCFILEMFVRQASLLRPIGEQGKFRLAADFAQMESAVSPLSPRLPDLGRPYRAFRAFRPLLFQTPDHVASSPSVGDVLPHSIVLHFLFARAPSEMRSPHQTAGWSQARYSGWLDDHPNERERLLLVEGALEAYVATVRARHGTQFDPIYPVMRGLLEKGFERVGKGSTFHSAKVEEPSPSGYAQDSCRPHFQIQPFQ